MNRPDYVADFESVADVALDGLLEALSTLPRRRASEVTIGELASLAGNPTGVYLFFEADNGRLMYVGKATSRSFIDRIPAHFDPREEAWMNSLPKHVRDHFAVPYAEALGRALDLELLILGVDGAAADGGQVEAVLRGHLKPLLNSTKRTFDGGRLLRQVTQAPSS